jgi:hypothetical protein
MMKTGIIPVRICVGAAMTLLVACVDREPTAVDRARMQLASVADESIIESPILLAIARQLPSFGGMYFNERDQLVVQFAGAPDLAAAERVIRPLLGAHQPAQFVSQNVRHSFLALARYRTLLGRFEWGPNGLLRIAVNERMNRVEIGVSETAQGVVAKIKSAMSDLDIPNEAVTLGVTRPVRQMSAPARLSLSPQNGSLHSWPGAIIGGYEITSPSGCTVGFPAIRNSQQGFVTNSHCTATTFEPDFGPFSVTGYYVGDEAMDPPHFPCSFWVGGYGSGPWPCRNADAAFVRAIGTPIQLGHLARVVSQGSTEVDASNPTHQITSAYDYVLAGEVLQRIGQVSGLATGIVMETCEDVWTKKEGEWIWEGKVKKCSDQYAGMDMEPGDSGSPVFFLKGDGTVELRGIMFGHCDDPYPCAGQWGSNLHQIKLDLGDMFVFDPGPPQVFIAGPTRVPAGITCQWQVENISGLTPYHDYVWNAENPGYQTGDTPVITGAPTASGGLLITLKDYYNRSGGAQIYVEVYEDPMAVDCPPS